MSHILSLPLTVSALGNISMPGTAPDSSDRPTLSGDGLRPNTPGGDRPIIPDDENGNHVPSTVVSSVEAHPEAPSMYFSMASLQANITLKEDT